MDNVKHIWIDMQRDIPPELLPVIGERSSICQPANNKSTPAPLPPETEVGDSGGGNGEITNNNKTITAEATVVELPPPAGNDVDPGSSPDEDWDDDHTSVRVDFHIFCKPEKEVCLDDEEDNNDENSSSENEDTDAKVTSDLKIGM